MDTEQNVGARWPGNYQEWQTQLDRARTSKEVLSVTKAFLSQFGIAETELPANLIPGRLDDPKDIEGYAVKLARAYLSRTSATMAGLHQLSSYFTKAALRIMEIEGRLKKLPPAEAQDSTLPADDTWPSLKK